MKQFLLSAFAAYVGLTAMAQGQIGGGPTQQSYDFCIDEINYRITSRMDSLTPGTVKVVNNVMLPPEAPVVLPDTVSYNDSTYTVTAIGAYAFKQCVDMPSIVLPSTLQTIGESAFTSCRILQMPQLPASLKEIGKDAFSGCFAIQEINIPAGLTLGSSAFFSCKGLKKATFDDSYTELPYQFLAYCDSLTDVKLPASLTKIPNSFFDHCKMLDSLDLPASVKELGGMSFCSTAFKEPIFLPEMNNVPAQIWEACPNLGDVVIPDFIESIEGSAFARSGVKFVQLPDNPKLVLGKYVFKDCAQLDSVSIPNDSTNLNYGTFQNCVSLRSIKFPAYDKYVWQNICNGCTSLTTIIIPEPAIIIHDGAFTSCPAIQDIYSYPVNPPYGGQKYKWFDAATYTTATLHIPNGSYDAYQKKSFKKGTTTCYCFWYKFTHIEEMQSGVEVPEEALTSKVETARYDLQGRRLSAPTTGINIVRYSDGTTAKVAQR